jgi:hypothetical protein
MNRNKWLTCLAGVSLLVSVVASPALAGQIHVFAGNDSQPKQSVKIKRAKKNGPPDHAPANGYRAQFQYRYYPDAEVYYDAGRKLYFYFEGNGWRIGASLPSSLQASLSDSVNLELDTDKPFLYHDDHKAQYPPGQARAPQNGQNVAKQ